MAKDSEQGTRSVSEIESDIAAARQRLAGTVDELAFRAQPKEIARRQKEAARVKLDEATRAPDGELRTERISAMLGALSAVLVGMGLLRRRRG
jgi:hypothetical protein